MWQHSQQHQQADAAAAAATQTAAAQAKKEVLSTQQKQLIKHCTRCCQCEEQDGQEADMDKAEEQIEHALPSQLTDACNECAQQSSPGGEGRNEDVVGGVRPVVSVFVGGDAVSVDDKSIFGAEDWTQVGFRIGLPFFNSPAIFVVLVIASH